MLSDQSEDDSFTNAKVNDLALINSNEEKNGDEESEKAAGDSETDELNQCGDSQSSSILNSSDEESLIQSSMSCQNAKRIIARRTENVHRS